MLNTSLDHAMLQYKSLKKVSLSYGRRTMHDGEDDGCELFFDAGCN